MESDVRGYLCDTRGLQFGSTQNDFSAHRATLTGSWWDRSRCAEELQISYEAWLCKLKKWDAPNAERGASQAPQESA
jgi:hypothetical protein